MTKLVNLQVGKFLMMLVYEHTIHILNKDIQNCLQFLNSTRKVYLWVVILPAP